MMVSLTLVIENRVVILGGFNLLSGTLVLPLSYALSDIITEVYGYPRMRQLIWTSLIVLYIIGFIIFVIMLLPTDKVDQKSNAYQIVFEPFHKDIITYSIAALVSIFLNSYILSKWKVLTKGRFFWIRSLGSTMIGEAIFITTWALLGFSSKFGLAVLLQLMLASYLVKILYNLVTIIPSALLVDWLKKSENYDMDERGIKFNPFTWKTQ